SRPVGGLALLPHNVEPGGGGRVRSNHTWQYQAEQRCEHNGTGRVFATKSVNHVFLLRRGPRGTGERCCSCPAQDRDDRASHDRHVLWAGFVLRTSDCSSATADYPEGCPRLHRGG